MLPYYEDRFFCPSGICATRGPHKSTLFDLFSFIDHRYLEKELKGEYTCEKILGKLKTMNFADIQEQGYVPLYTRDKLTDALHKVCGFETDFQFITKSNMRTIQKKSKFKE